MHIISQHLLDVYYKGLTALFAPAREKFDSTFRGRCRGHTHLKRQSDFSPRYKNPHFKASVLL